MKITNTQAGPRGIHTTSGSVMLAPGETVDVEMEAGEIASAKQTGWFSFSEIEDPTEPADVGSEASADLDIEKMKPADLKVFLTDRGVEIPDGALKADLVELALANRDRPAGQ